MSHRCHKKEHKCKPKIVIPCDPATLTCETREVEKPKDCKPCGCHKEKPCEPKTCEHKKKRCEPKKDCGCHKEKKECEPCPKKEKCDPQLCTRIEARFDSPLATEPGVVGGVPGTVVLAGPPTAECFVSCVGHGFVLVEGFVNKTINFDGLDAAGTPTGPASVALRLPFSGLIEDESICHGDIYETCGECKLHVCSAVPGPANTTDFPVPTVTNFLELEIVRVCVRKVPGRNLAPILGALTPNTGAVGSLVTLTGANFYPGVNGVLFGSIPAEILNRTTTALIVRVPVGVAGQQFVTVTNVNGVVSNPLPFTGP